MWVAGSVTDRLVPRTPPDAGIAGRLSGRADRRWRTTRRSARILESITICGVCEWLGRQAGDEAPTETETGAPGTPQIVILS
jgi:hypothetical protein